MITSKNYGLKNTYFISAKTFTLMKHFFSAVVIIIGFINCNNNTQSNKKNSADDVFQKMADDYLDGYFAANPITAVSLGLHEGYDGKTPDYSKAALDAELSRMKYFDS